MIRMHYANCATFNADFDGDEINLHLPQARACHPDLSRVFKGVLFVIWHFVFYCDDPEVTEAEFGPQMALL